MNHKINLCLVLTCVFIVITSAAGYAADVKWAGFRSSIYGASATASDTSPAIPFPTPEVWEKASKTLAANFSGETQPTVVWIVGCVDTDDKENGKLHLEMKRPGPEYTDIHFVDDPNINWTDGYTDHEKWLTYFDEHGISVLLQVEPGHSDMLAVIQAVMKTWGHHPSVIGFGVDVEWYLNSNEDGGGDAKVDAATMLKWLDAIHQYKPEGKLMVKHWAPANLAGGSLKDIPADKRPYLIFCCDSQGVGGLQPFVNEMAAFAKAYDDGANSADVWFQIGYESDWWEAPSWAPENKPWFHTLKDGWKDGKDGIPAEERALLPGILGKKLAEAVGQNQKIGIIWVDFTMRHLYPNIFETPASK